MNHISLTITYLLLAILMASTSLYGQDVLYMKDGSSVECTVTSIDDSRVVYTAFDQELKAPINRLLMIFWGDGEYKVFDPGVANGYRTFAGNSSYDHILTYDSKLELIEIISQTGESIKYRQAGNPDGPTYSRELFNLLLIVYKDGRHEIFGDFEEVAEALLVVSPQDAELLAQSSSAGSPSIGREEADDQPVIEDIFEDPVDIGESGTMDPEEEAIVIEDDDDATIIREDDSNSIEVDVEAFQRKAKEKTATLGQYFGIIASKTTPWQEANQAIDLAVQLFLSEDAQVEVSSVNSVQKKTYPIRVYLERLKLLKYDEVDLEWSEISFVSNLRKGPDGNYYGSISFVQKFTGYRDGQIAYTDLTRKSIEVVLKGYEKQVAGETKELWDVFLSDIGVVNTRRG